MSDSKITGFSVDIHAAQDNFNKAIEGIAERVRQELIIPACKRYKLTFLSGNGDWLFIDSKDQNIVKDSFNPMWNGKRKANSAMGKTLLPILDLLDTEIFRNDYFGFYVGDVKKSDY